MATRKQPAKKRGATNNRRQPSKKPRREWRLPGWIWGLAGLVAGFLLSQHQHGVAPWQVEDSPLATVLPRSVSPESAPAPPAEPSEPPMPTFEFYTLLPESEVIAPGGEMPASTATPPPAAEVATNADSAPADDPIAEVIAANQAGDRRRSTEQSTTATNASGQRYMLQAASFREASDARQLRSRLRDFGLLAQVSEVKAGGGQTWHRVQVGPYEDRRELSRAQDLMTTQGIEPLLIQLNN
ncbi:MULTISPECIES: SPOR domain-containing protein [Halomonas]|uniref:SPOR domain-containing protein n=2 Tax=Halomonas TaxID=2745 RepID=A0A7X4W0M8_9GAMM|nr:MULTISPECIES: SPOR domain-containing protein [Halomonas]MDR5900725.1 SPOR domain-containing protein [Halomonas icarae]NAW13807.1 SPOR domain-containing protein [Halomonas icarae]TDB02640.1 SPOR domain-containing protein [Halomonas marinisediminis]